MSKLKEELYNIGIVPVIAIDNVEDAVPLATALVNGGLNCAEITFRTDAAYESIKAIRKAFPDMIIAAGTVLTTEQVDKAVEAGANFVVSPGLNRSVVEYATKKGVLMIPGCSNPSDVEIAIELGLQTVKFFPSENIGGLPMIKAMAAPYKNIDFMPTGGIGAHNVKDYLAFDKIVCCGGSFMCPSDLIKNKEFAKIEEITRQAVKEMLGFRVAHIGINSENKAEAERTVKMLGNLFMTNNIRPTSQSFFVNEEIEVMDHVGRGKLGHIAIGTKNVKRAMYQLERQGFTFDMESANKDALGNIKAIYINEEISGFRFHLIKE